MRKVPERGTPRFYELLDPRQMQRRSNFDKIPDPLVRLSSKQRVTWKLYARTIVEHISFSRGPIHQRWNVDDRHGDDEEDEEDDEKDEEGEKDDVFARRSSGFAMLRFRESIPLERSSRERLNRGHWPLLLRQILNEAVRRQLTNNFGTSTAWPESAFYLLISLLQSAFEHIMRCSRSYDSRYSPDTGGRGQCFSVALSSLLFNLIRLRADALLRSPWHVSIFSRSLSASSIRLVTNFTDSTTLRLDMLQEKLIWIYYIQRTCIFFASIPARCLPLAEQQATLCSLLFTRGDDRWWYSRLVKTGTNARLKENMRKMKDVVRSRWKC